MTMAHRCLLATTLTLCATHPAFAQGVDSFLLAEQARGVLRKHCVSCHSGAKARGGLQILDFGRSAAGRAPDMPDPSELLQLVECGSMPRGTRPKVAAAEVKVLRDWVAGGTTPFAAEASDDYALRQILLDVRSADRARERYFAFNHLLGTPQADPELLRATLTRAINLLSWKKEIVRPTPIDPTGTIFRVNLDDLGWADPLYPGSRANRFDLVLLEYPHAVIPRSSPVYDELDSEYLQKAALLRPVAFVRGDWFVSAAGRSPLYEDLLRLPTALPTLEKKLGVEDSARFLGGMNERRIVNAPRLVESRSTPKQVFWRTLNLPGAKDAADLVKTADTKTGEGEVVFSLPNGLPGFFVNGADGVRVDSIPADHLAEGQHQKIPLRTGFNCLKCHDHRGVNAFPDVLAPALNTSGLPANQIARLREFIPGQKKLGELIDADNRRFAQALTELTGKKPEKDVLATDVIDRLNREPTTARPATADETAIPPLDGLAQPDWSQAKPLKIELEAFNKDGEKTTVFKQNERMYMVVKNNGDTDLWIELISTGRSGTVQVIPLPQEKRLFLLPKGKTHRLHNETVSVGEELGKNPVTVFASEKPFLPGEILTTKAPDSPDYVADRFVHPFPNRGDDLSKFAQIEKRTVVIETRAK